MSSDLTITTAKKQEGNKRAEVKDPNWNDQFLKNGKKAEGGSKE